MISHDISILLGQVGAGLRQPMRRLTQFPVSLLHTSVGINDIEVRTGIHQKCNNSR